MVRGKDGEPHAYCSVSGAFGEPDVPDGALLTLGPGNARCTLSVAVWKTVLPSAALRSPAPMLSLQGLSQLPLARGVSLVIFHPQIDLRQRLKIEKF